MQDKQHSKKWTGAPVEQYTNFTFATWNLNLMFGHVVKKKARTSLRKRFDQMCLALAGMSNDGTAPHVIAIQETGVSAQTDPLDVPGYRWYQKPRLRSKYTGEFNQGGGVGFLVSESIKHSDVDLAPLGSHASDHSELWIRIKGPAGGILLGTMYGDQRKFLTDESFTPGWADRANFARKAIDEYAFFFSKPCGINLSIRTYDP